MIEELKKSDKTRRRSRKEAKENSKAKENSIVGKSDLEKPEKTSPKKMSDNPVKTTENTKTTDKQPKINEVLQSKNASQTQNNNKNNNKEITVSPYQDMVRLKRADAPIIKFLALTVNKIELEEVLANQRPNSGHHFERQSY